MDRHQDSLDQVLPDHYEEIRRIAAAYAAREAVGNSLQPTALVHEVYLRFSNQGIPEHVDRAHFLAIVGRLIRQILVDHARHKSRQRRGGDRQRVELEASLMAAEDGTVRAVDLLSLDSALNKLELRNPRHAKMVEMRFFSGLSNQEVAKELGVDVSTVKRDWRVVRLWLHSELS